MNSAKRMCWRGLFWTRSRCIRRLLILETSEELIAKMTKSKDTCDCFHQFLFPYPYCIRQR